MRDGCLQCEAHTQVDGCGVGARLPDEVQRRGSGQGELARVLTLELSAASERAAHHVAPATSPLPGVTCRDMS